MRSNERSTSMKELYLKIVVNSFTTNPEQVESCLITTPVIQMLTSVVMSLVLLGPAVRHNAAVAVEERTRASDRNEFAF